jgi:hypothetical protein
MTKSISAAIAAALLCLAVQHSAAAAPITAPAPAGVSRADIQDVRWVTRCHRHRRHHRWVRVCHRVRVP